MFGWGKNKDEDGNRGGFSFPSPKSPLSFSSKKNKLNGSKQRRRSWGGKERQQSADLPAVMEKNTTTMHLAETYSGIEVSLSQDKNVVGSGNRVSPFVISIQQQLADRQKVYRAQFNVSNLRPGSQPQGPSEKDGFKRRSHRLPLYDSKTPPVKFDDALSLLKNYEAKDEAQCIKDEIVHLDKEISALEKDRLDIERKHTYEPYDNDAGGDSGNWDINRRLAKQQLTATQKTQLQKERGLCLTLSLDNGKTRESLLSKCGFKPAAANKMQGRKGQNASVVTLRPNNCREGGAATSIQQISLLKTQAESTFFISRDSGNSFYSGRLPDRLFRRMTTSGLEPHHQVRDLLYLSTGPLGCYYAEFRSGECWWGLTVDDEELDAIFSEWDVYRVVFGPCSNFGDKKNQAHKYSSWIVLARDGRAAWKNLPARLHSRLQSRLANESSPADVALGCDGSYFIRFLDGSTDWQLPAKTAGICSRIEREGGRITSMSLHPELTHDFIIRHR